MANEIVYMLGIVLAGFAVNYCLRALPFLLFAGRDRELPAWVERFGVLISPVMIACLIVYSYSGLAWKTAWPYLAGVVAIGLQLWKRNALASIIVATVLYMCLLNCGCTTARTEVGFDASNPAIRVTETEVFFAGEKVDPLDVPDMLDDLDVPKTRTIHIKLDGGVRNLNLAKAMMALLAKNGWTRPVLVTEKHAESRSVGKKEKRNVYR